MYIYKYIYIHKYRYSTIQELDSSLWTGGERPTESGESAQGACWGV